MDLPYEVDGKGTIIYAMENGGKIRDDGQEVHFCAHDSETLKLKAFVETIEARKKKQLELIKTENPKTNQKQTDPSVFESFHP